MFFVFLVLLVFSYTFFPNKIIENKKLEGENANNLKSSNEVMSFTNYLLRNLKSPYVEHNYIIQNNDSIEKILNNYNVEYSETKLIVNSLKKKKLSNIYAGRELEIVIKKNDNKNSLYIILHWNVLICIFFISQI